MSEPNFPIVKNWGLAFPRPMTVTMYYRDRDVITRAYLRFMDKKNPEKTFHVPGAVRLYGRIFSDTTRPNNNGFVSINLDKIYKVSKYGLVAETVTGRKYRIWTNKACKGFYKYLQDWKKSKLENKIRYLVECPGDIKNFV